MNFLKMLQALWKQPKKNVISLTIVSSLLIIEIFFIWQTAGVISKMLVKAGQTQSFFY